MASHKYEEATEYLRRRLPKDLSRPVVAIICGSGLGGLADTVKKDSKIDFDYAELPYFPQSTVEGHEGKLVFGFLEQDVPAVLMVGRSHFYEGHDIEHTTFPIRVFRLLGVENMIVTNAAGGLNDEYAVGDIMVLNDHIFLAGLAGNHPLRGPNADEFGPRFLPLSDAYDLELRRSLHVAWAKLRAVAASSRKLHEGVYAYVGGPSYETRAECRMLRQWGADVVGMSTVAEAIVARHCGIKILAISLVTNKAVLAPPPRGDDPLIQSATREGLETISKQGMANHEEVLQEGKLAAVEFQRLVAQVIRDVFRSGS